MYVSCFFVFRISKFFQLPRYLFDEDGHVQLFWIGAWLAVVIPCSSAVANFDFVITCKRSFFCISFINLMPF